MIGVLFALLFANSYVYLFIDIPNDEYWKRKSESGKMVPSSKIWQHCASDGCCDSAFVNQQ
jgi:hypothetical protein